MKTDQYHSLSIGIHWITALIVLGLLSVGFYMTAIEFSPFKLNIYMLHKSFGMTVLALVIIRILWRLINPPPEPLDSHAKWEKSLSKIIHFLLYFGLIAMPMSGWIMSSAGEYPVNFFGLFDFPALTDKNENLYALTKAIHELGAYSLICAVGLHFLGAAKHHIIDKDSTLKRMGGNFFSLAMGGALLLSAVIFSTPHLSEKFNQFPKEEIINQDTDSKSAMETPATEHSEWVINHGMSKIGFKFMQYGQAVHGSFDQFSGTIIFDPENLDSSHVEIEIDIASIQTGSADRDQQALSKEWFAQEQYAKARFEAESFSESEDKNYIANGYLTIRDQKMPITLPFSLKISEDVNGKKTANMQSDIALQRLDFGIGQGEWKNTEAIDNVVEISISVAATLNK